MSEQEERAKGASIGSASGTREQGGEEDEEGRRRKGEEAKGK